MTRTLWLALGILVLGVMIGGAIVYTWNRNNGPFRGNQGDGFHLFRTEPDTYEIERTDYHLPQAESQDVLTDDRLEDKIPPIFDPTRVDRRPLGEKGGWLLNASAAIIRLDVPILKPDQEAHLLTLHPSYAAAVGPHAAGGSILPSVNLLDGKAKQFDDGLYAALDQAYYQGLENRLLSHVQLVRRLYEKVGKDSVAAPFLAAGLELAGVQVAVVDRQTKARLRSEFQANEVASKPIGFYTWNDTLAACFRFLRFFQKEFEGDDLAVPLALAQVLAQDPALLADYQKALGFYAKLTNPYVCLSVADVRGKPTLDMAAFVKLCDSKRVWHKTVALLPPSSSREMVLFEKLFPLGLPPNADLMRELVRKIRSGEVDLQPKPDSGWYDYQVYALETLLLPEKGVEHNKLLLTKAYKRRMLEAFKALMTKRRETHVRQLGIAEGKAVEPPPPPDKIKPRLRIEPCPSYYLRTARAYAFLANFLEAALGPEALQRLHGLKKEGQRKQPLHAELRGMRDLFYGLYLMSAEDIGLAPEFAPEERVERDHCYQLAADWLPNVFQDEDLATDTRVAVPIFVDLQRRVTRLWVTLGVRLTKLEAGYARPPQIKPTQGAGDWQVVEASRLEAAHYLIPVDEFAEVELPGLRVLTREELRAICDREKTKEAILQALRQ
jgi:hypothetical protein